MSLKLKLNVNVVLTFTDNARDNTGSKIFSCYIGLNYNEYTRGI